MPIQLKNRFFVGDLDKTGNGYGFCQLTSLHQNGLTFGVSIEYEIGESSGDYYQHWQRGEGTPTFTHEMAGAQVVPLWSKMPKEGESVGEAIRRVIYESMIENGLVDGTIVNNPPLPPADVETPTSDDDAETPAEPVGDDTAPTPAPDAETPAEDAPEPAAEPATEDAPSEDAEATEKPEAANPS